MPYIEGVAVSGRHPWDGSFPVVAGPGRAATYWPAWVVASEPVVYVLGQHGWAVPVAALVPVIFLGSLAVALRRSVRRAEPLRLSSPDEADRSRRATRFALAVGCGLVLVALRSMRTEGERLASSMNHSMAWSGAALDAAQLPTLAIALSMLLVSSATLFLAARRAGALPGGVLEETERGPTVRGTGVTWYLTTVPEGCAPGEPLAFLANATETLGASPYRSGRPLASAPRVWRASPERLAAQLSRRARRHLLWAALTTVTLALLAIV